MTYQIETSCTGHDSVVSAIKWNADGRLLASCSADKSARVWTLEGDAAAEQQKFEGHANGVSDVCWHPREAYVATASDDLTLGLWDLETGQRLRTFKGHTHFVFCCRFHNHGSILVSGSLDESVRYWDIRSGSCIKAIPAHSDPITAMDISRDGQLLATASSDGLCRLWDFSTGHLLRTLLDVNTPPVATVQFSPNNRYLLASCLDSKASTIKVWDWQYADDKQQGRVVRQLAGHKNVAHFVPAMFVHRTGVLAAAEDGCVCMWDINSGAMEQHKLKLSPASAPDAVLAAAPAEAASGAAASAPVAAVPDSAAPAPAAATGDVPASNRADAAPAYPDTINAFDVHEGTGIMAYTHIGCADHRITICPLPPPVPAR